jgi:hypothetical protein
VQAANGRYEAVFSVTPMFGFGRGRVKTKTDFAVNQFCKFKPQNLADLNHAWDFWLISLNLQKRRGFLHAHAEETITTGSFAAFEFTSTR